MQKLRYALQFFQGRVEFLPAPGSSIRPGLPKRNLRMHSVTEQTCPAGTIDSSPSKGGGPDSQEAALMSIRMKWIPLLLWSLCPLAGAQEEPVRLLTPFQAKQSAPGSFDVSITAEVLHPLPALATVPLVHSYLRFVAPLRTTSLLEDSLLDSLYAVDINGNRILDEVSVSQREGGLRLDMMPVETVGPNELGPQSPYRADGSPKRYFLDPDCPSFMVMFYDPPVMGLELQHHGYQPEVEEVPNPSLQVMVLEPCVGPSGPRDECGEPNFQLSFDGPAPDKNLMFAWEPSVFQAQRAMPQWLRVQWFSLPLSTQPGPQVMHFRLDCTQDSNPVAILAQINYATQKGVRLRTKPMVQAIWPGSDTPSSK